MKKVQISPSILSADFSQLGNEIKKLEKGGADMIHVDVMDGHFVPNLTIGPPVIKALKKHSSVLFDVHLMISPVHRYIQAYSDAGADIITIHPEATDDLKSSISRIKELKKKVGVSLNPETKIDIILDVLDQINLVPVCFNVNRNVEIVQRYHSHSLISVVGAPALILQWGTKLNY